MLLQKAFTGSLHLRLCLAAIPSSLWQVPYRTMSQEQESAPKTAKRKLDEDASSPQVEEYTFPMQGDGVGDPKDSEQDQGESGQSKRSPFPKRKVAMLVSYNGEGYQGLQNNPGAKTLEGEMELAMFKAGAISADNHGDFHKIGWQRAARTDKGVSALGQVVTVKALMIPDLIEKINENLPEQIRFIDFTRVTGAFNAKNHCEGRKYSYMIPTFAFAPANTGPSTEHTIYAPEFTLPQEKLQLIRRILSKFQGTRNFHNYTVHKKAADPSSMRVIQSFECSEPFAQNGFEVVLMTIVGQSFMLHQIRKMVGTIVSVVRGDLSEENFMETMTPKIIKTPMAPATGLFLEKCYYKGYESKNRNKEPLFADEKVEGVKTQFRTKYIIPHILETEKTEFVVSDWLRCLDKYPMERNRPDPAPEADEKEQGDE